MSCIFLPDSVGVGSSGALLGMLAAWIVWIIFRWKKIPEQCRSQRNCQLFIVLASVVITLAMSFAQYVDWAAHFGGAVQGALWAMALLCNELDNKFNMWCVRIGSAGLAVASLIWAIYYMAVLEHPSTANFSVWDQNDDWQKYSKR